LSPPQQQAKPGMRRTSFPQPGIAFGVGGQASQHLADPHMGVMLPHTSAAAASPSDATVGFARLRARTTDRIATACPCDRRNPLIPTAGRNSPPHAARSSLLSGAADVVLQKLRPLILMVQEAPLNLIHLRNMHLDPAAPPHCVDRWHRNENVDRGRRPRRRRCSDQTALL